MTAMGNLVRLQGLKDRLQIAIQSRLLAFDRMKPPAAEIVHERLNPADTSQRVETSFHRLAGNEPNAKGAHERFDRWLDGEIEQKQAARGSWFSIWKPDGLENPSMVAAPTARVSSAR